jgi:hypothetical protein
MRKPQKHKTGPIVSVLNGALGFRKTAAQLAKTPAHPESAEHWLGG